MIWLTVSEFYTTIWPLIVRRIILSNQTTEYLAAASAASATSSIRASEGTPVVVGVTAVEVTSDRMVGLQLMGREAALAATTAAATLIHRTN